MCLLLRVTVFASSLQSYLPCFASQTGKCLQTDLSFSHGIPLLQSNLEKRDGIQSFSDWRSWEGLHQKLRNSNAASQPLGFASPSLVADAPLLRHCAGFYDDPGRMLPPLPKLPQQHWGTASFQTVHGSAAEANLAENGGDTQWPPFLPRHWDILTLSLKKPPALIQGHHAS